ncbi:dna repair exonuclease [Phaffia rhodozyma]|uniref:Double-strand break repair protein n=1 Tax=Phaffia rhodozyma TaxID=264483 RepID=A0A0F7SRQ2_PHARH|nr:dna repair exonuclease [Phaffia rhodozyma]
MSSPPVSSQLSEGEPPLTRPTPLLRDIEDDGSNTIRIMLATDNHLGYLEKDPIRGNDSFDAFREILELARKEEVDFILLAGDLFHENYPSRYTLHQTIALLREYSQGDRPVQIELLSDPNEGKAAGFTFPAINYEDYNLNVGIPVFSIHGNHDDPQGTSAAGALSAIDILSVSGQLNYFGKTDLGADEARPESAKQGLTISPVLLRKGTTKLAMYGIGNIKDVRMSHELRNGRVRMLRPEEDIDNWFNIVLVHQNRVAHNRHEYIPENMFDDSTDLVVWGHEHDCRIVPEMVADKQYWITQPGSSVATSLADGEAIDKHVGLLEIQGKHFQITPMPLKTVRPFVMKHIELSVVAEETGLNLENKPKVTEYLRQQVLKCVAEANAKWDEKNLSLSPEVDGPKRPKPLIRLKVETTGVLELTNVTRFGEGLNQLVANPGNLLQFYRRKKFAKRTDKVSVDQPDLDLSDDDGLAPGQRQGKIKMADLVKEYLTAQKLDVLPENGLEDAVEKFVEKGSKTAIKDFVAGTLKAFNSNARMKNLTEDEIQDELIQQKNLAESQFGGKRPAVLSEGKVRASNAPDSDVMMAESMGEDSDDSVFTRATGRAKKATTSTAAKAKKVPATKKPPAAAKKKQALFNDSEEEIFIHDTDEDDCRTETQRTKGHIDDFDDDEDGDEDEEITIASPPRRRAAPQTSVPASFTLSRSRAPPKAAASANTSRRTKRTVADTSGSRSQQSQLNLEPVPTRPARPSRKNE